MKSIFEYLEYRDFLLDHFQHEKEEKSFYSYRYIAQKTGIDASFYVKVLQKQKHISENRIGDLADFLQLTGRKREYFITLANYNRTRSSTVARELFGKLVSLKNSVGTRIHNENYFLQWYNIPIRELLNHFDFDGDYRRLAQMFYPPIKESEARNGIKTLKELGMAAVDDTGFLRSSVANVTTGDDWQSLAIREFQKTMIHKAAEAVENFPKEERDISTVTVSTSRKCLDAISERLSQARREIIEIINAEDEIDGVYQINLQVFPLTRKDIL